MQQARTLIVGLGNPGAEYAKTRHNVGFLAVEAFANAEGAPAFSEKPRFEAALTKKGSFLFMKPLTFMNRSGEAVQKVAAYYDIPAERIWVIHDDKDLPFGTLRIRQTGSSGGHNGVADIIQHLKTDHFVRFRVGTQNPRIKKIDTASYVLSPFTAAEQKHVKQEVVPQVIEALDFAVDHGIPGTMTKFN